MEFFKKKYPALCALAYMNFLNNENLFSGIKNEEITIVREFKNF